MLIRATVHCVIQDGIKKLVDVDFFCETCLFNSWVDVNIRRCPSESQSCTYNTPTVIQIEAM